MNIQKPRGTRDYLGNVFKTRRELENKFIDFFVAKGYLGLETPIFEQKNLFTRTVGEQTDIVQKELFNLEKKSDEVYSLRPEFTAGTIRSLIEAGLKSIPLPVKIFSVGPCFRYERPQKGRKRQFNQLNIEVIGKKSVAIDQEVIQSAVEFLLTIGIKNISVNVNTFGDLATREEFSNKLREYLPGSQGLCEDCLRRSAKNPLRVLDCKNEECQKTVSRGPKINDVLKNDDQKYFDSVLAGLKDCLKDKVEIAYTPNLVRGLDYYTGIVFEINMKMDESRMNSIGGGGRYDNLVRELGGPDLPAVGYALGLDRIIEAMEK